MEISLHLFEEMSNGDWETWNIIPVLYILHIYIQRLHIYMARLFMMVYTCFERLALVFGNRIYERLALKVWTIFEIVYIFFFKREK
ncbi:hypothetical protein V8C40DRAFT_155023 [Trichoderma camerunense]